MPETPVAATAAEALALATALTGLMATPGYLASVEMITAVAKMITVIAEGQPADVRAKGWERWERFWAAVDKLAGYVPPAK